MSLLTRHRRTLPVIVCIVCTAVVAAAFWFGFEPLRRLEFGARDFLARHGKKPPARPDLVFLAIDQASVSLDGASPEEIEASPALQAMKRDGWPWPRDVYAMVIDRLASAGARVITFDMLYPTERQGDGAFRAALERHRDKVVIGANFVETPITKTLTAPSPTLIPQGDTLDPRVGYVNFWADHDEVVRHARYQITADEVNGWLPAPGSEVFDSLTACILRKLGRGDLIPREAKCFRFSETFESYPLWQIFVQRMWDLPPCRSGELFRGKVVLVGPEGNWAKDVLRTPLGQTPGPELHLHALNAALNKDFVREPSRAANVASILIAGLAAWGLGAFVAQPFLRFAVFIGTSVLYFIIAWFLFGSSREGVLIALAPPLLAANGSGLVWLICEHVLERIDKTRTRRTLERYVSKDLVREILDNPASLLTTLGGVRKSVAILFSDLRNFTTMTEQADSAQLVAQLNEYFTGMVKRIFDSKGTLDKFIGDAIMAVWGEVQSEGPAQDVRRAVTAALQMQAALAELNTRWESRGIRTFQMGIGINYGPVIVGNIGATGATEKMELTVIGDPVNIASRLEGLTKEYGVELLLGESAADLVADAFHLQLVDLVRLKGKTQPIRVYTVLGAQHEIPSPSLRDYLVRYAEGLKRYQMRKFDSAMHSFRGCLASRPGDPMAAMYAGRCQDLLNDPPGPEWDGVFVMTKK
jgi:adenylate cyclase